MRTLLNALSRSRSLQWLCLHFPPARRIARRFIAGETLDDAIAVVRKLNDRGIEATLNQLGENVASRDDARRVAGEYGVLLQRISDESLRATISVKPSHLGLELGPEVFHENLATVVARARALGITVEVDMEDSSTVDDTLAAFHSLLDEGADLRIALPAQLFRTAGDLEALIAKGSSARLVKGAYSEPAEAAWREKAAVDRSYAELVERSFDGKTAESGFYPAFGTHDHRLIETIFAEAAKRSVPGDRFEFQMLLGVRRDWQEKLVADGWRLRLYVPFGSQWYPYFMRRLAERPANLLFILRALFGR